MIAAGLGKAGLSAQSRHVGIALSAAIVLAATAIHLFTHTNTDVSWLLTIGERWLGGETPYVDIVEVNPPASILLYMPAVLLGRLLRVEPELIVVILVVGGAVASAVFTCRILRRAELIPAAGTELQRAAMLALLLLAPAGDFAEREHIGLLAILPLLAVLAGRASRKHPARRDALVAGLAAGVALAVKPIFGLGLIGPLAYLMAQRGWRVAILAPEPYLAGLVPLLYGACLPICFPAFTSNVLHMVLVAYVPMRFPLTDLALSPIGLLFADLCFMALCLRVLTRSGTWSLVLLLSSVGFYAGFLIQGKAWAYQGLPAVLLAALSVLTAIGMAGGTRFERHIRMLALPAVSALAVMGAIAFDAHPTMGAGVPGLEQALRRLGPHPALMAITSEIAVGHPLVREIGGRWVGTFPYQWITTNTRKLRIAGVSGAAAQELDRLSQEERTTTVHDVLSKRPDAILVQADAGERYIEDTPGLKAAFENYHRSGQYGSLTLWVRQQPNAQLSASGPHGLLTELR